MSARPSHRRTHTTQPRRSTHPSQPQHPTHPSQQQHPTHTTHPTQQQQHHRTTTSHPQSAATSGTYAGSLKPDSGDYHGQQISDTGCYVGTLGPGDGMRNTCRTGEKQNVQDILFLDNLGGRFVAR
jgi:hypothetical protein